MQNDQENTVNLVFVTPIRTLTDAELSCVAGGEFGENEANKPSAIKIDASGYFQ